jgi:hypothetical protein
MRAYIRCLIRCSLSLLHSCPEVIARAQNLPGNADHALAPAGVVLTTSTSVTQRGSVFLTSDPCPILHLLATDNAQSNELLAWRASRILRLQPPTVNLANGVSNVCFFNRGLCRPVEQATMER